MKVITNIRELVGGYMGILKILFPSVKERMRFLACYISGCVILLIGGVLFIVKSNFPPTTLEIIVLIMLVGILLALLPLSIWEQRASNYIFHKKED